MKIQRIAALVNKELKRTFREPAILFMIFLFPAVFVLTFGAAFSGFGSPQPTYPIGVVNLDQANMVNFTRSFIEALSATKILSTQIYADNQTAQIDLSQSKIQAVIIIPREFSQSLFSYNMAPDDPNKWVNASILLYLDKGSIVATQVIPPIIQQVLTAFMNRNQ